MSQLNLLVGTLGVGVFGVLRGCRKSGSAHSGTLISDTRERAPSQEAQLTGDTLG